MAQIHCISGKKTFTYCKNVFINKVGCQIIDVLGLYLNPHMENLHFNTLITQIKIGKPCHHLQIHSCKGCK
jgi:hypothetical protein